MAYRASVLIIARSAQFRESLQVLMQASPQVGAVLVAEDGPTARAMVEEVQPALILLDCDIVNSEIRTILEQLKVRWAQARYLVFVESDCDRRQAHDAGADVVLVKGVRAATILEAIEGLLSGGNPNLRSFGGGS